MDKKETYATINVLSSTKERFITQYKQYKETDDEAMNRLMDSKGAPKTEGKRKASISQWLIILALGLLSALLVRPLPLTLLLLLIVVLSAIAELKKN